MELFIPTLLLALYVKTALDWIVVLLQWKHMLRTFSGHFSISLAVADTLLDLVITCLFFVQDFTLWEVRFTAYHICLLVQVVGFVYGTLHWPAFLLTGLDTYWTASSSGQTPTFWARKLGYVFGTLLLWGFGFAYLFWDSDFNPVVEDDSLFLQKCQVVGGPQCRQVAMVLLLMLTCAALYAYFWQVKKSQENGQSHSAVDLQWSVCSFLGKWSSFVVLVALILGFGPEVPAYLEMNVPWLCLFHSFHVAVTLGTCTCLLCSEKDTTLKKTTSTTCFCLWTPCLT